MNTQHLHQTRIHKSNATFRTKVMRSELLYKFMRSPLIMSCSFFLSLIFLFAIFAQFVSPYDPYNVVEIDIMNSDYPPFWIEGASPDFILGTDDHGRDLWSALIYGIRTSLFISICAVMIQAVLGCSIGLIAGYYGGVIDNFLMRTADIQLSLSTTMVAIIFMAFVQSLFDTQTFNQYAAYFLIIVLGISEWPQFARTTRATVLAEKEKEYVDSAHILGFNSRRIMLRHIFPNSFSPIFVISAIQFSNAIIGEAYISFLGLGMPPSQPSLGALIHTGFEYIFSGSWWITVIPSLTLIAIVLMINLIGDWIFNIFNPKLYKE